MIKKNISKIKAEFCSIRKKMMQISLWGLLLVTVSLIIISAFSVPLWMRSYRILRGGALAVFFCYFFSIVFFFLCGALFAILYSCRKSCRHCVGRAMIDVCIAYIARLLWLVIFFGINSPFISIICLITSLVFLIFLLICTLKISTVLSLVQMYMIFETVCFVIFTFKFMLVN